MLRALIVSLIALLSLPAPLLAQDFPARFDVQGVARDDVLNIRAQADATSAILGTLAPDATRIEIVAASPDGRWGLLRQGEGAGWVSMRYLAPVREPIWNSAQVAMTCGGTEPFWTLRLFLPDNRAEFLSPDTSFDLRTDAPALPRTEYPRTLAVPLWGAREGVAVIRAGLCNDGMSDQVFGLETQLYWRGEVNGLSGCCRLGD